MAKLPAKRETTLKKLYKMANDLSVKYDYKKNNEMWALCSDWNSAHGDEEIFMCDDEDENGTYRYFIEDDYFYLGE